MAVLQINSTRFLDPFCNNKQGEAGKIRRNDRIVFGHLLFASSFVSTHRLCSGKLFDWHLLTVACSVNKAVLRKKLSNTNGNRGGSIESDVEPFAKIERVI